MKVKEILETLKNLEKLSTCKKRQVGAFIIDTPAITGYNDLVINSHLSQLNCIECLKCSNHKERQEHNIVCEAIHAEIKCLLKLAWFEGINGTNETMAISYTPCYECCKAIIFMGIIKVAIAQPSSIHAQIKAFLNDSGVEVIELWRKHSEDEVE